MIQHPIQCMVIHHHRIFGGKRKMLFALRQSARRPARQNVMRYYASFISSARTHDVSQEVRYAERERETQSANLDCYEGPQYCPSRGQTCPLPRTNQMHFIHFCIVPLQRHRYGQCQRPDAAHCRCGPGAVSSYSSAHDGIDHWCAHDIWSALCRNGRWTLAAPRGGLAHQSFFFGLESPGQSRFGL